MNCKSSLIHTHLIQCLLQEFHRLYKDNGSYVKTITGTKTNGLLSSGYGYSGAYTIKATAGEHYYLELTFIDSNTSDSDYKTYTTNTAMAAA